MFRADGLDNPFSPNCSVGCTWDAVERLCEDSAAVESFACDGAGINVTWCDGETSSFGDPQAALIAVKRMS